MSNITEVHLKFVRDVVALARAQGMNNLTIEFDTSGEKNWLASEVWGLGPVKASWKQGRHGAETRIHMECTERVNLDEKGDVVENS